MTKERNNVDKDIQPPREHKEWYSRGYLPHFDHPDLIQMITFRLADALPSHLLAQWEKTLGRERDARKRQQMEASLDAGHGSCVLRDPRIGPMVEDTLLHFDAESYRLMEWVIMPNHVHLLAEFFAGSLLSEVVKSWKSFSAHEANRILGRSGQFWQEEYFDRFVRDAVHFENARRYIRENPVEASLVKHAEDWPYGSASWLRRHSRCAGRANVDQRSNPGS